jgi:heptaprenyl diphosphate synthase
MAICDGELQQAFTAGDGHLTEEQYLEKIRCKTAALFQTATETGAILSGTDEDRISALARYGLKVGLAFQVIDDVLDYVGDERTLGKPVGGDLRQGTLTLPALWVLRNLPSDRSVRQVLESGGEDEGAVQTAVRTVAESPAIAYSMDVARRLCSEARAALSILPDSPSRVSLMAIADYVVNRST